MPTSAPSKTLKNTEEKPPSPEKQKSAQEYIDARFLHDRFCKFEIPYDAATTIRTIRLIAQILPIQALKEAVLPFKLNNLRWFLTDKGKEFLRKQERRWQLDQKLEKLTFPAENQKKEIKQIVTGEETVYTPKIEEESQTLIDYLT